MKNLAAIRKKNGLTQMQFAKMFGVSTSTVAMWEAGYRKPDYHTIVRLCDFFKIGFEELSGTTLALNSILNENTSVPLVGYVQAGLPTYAEENVLGYENISDNLAKSGEFFALKVKGDSMEPKISEGDIVIVRRQSTVENGQIAVVLIGNEEATIKKIIKQQDGITIVPINPDFVPVHYSYKQCETVPVTIEGIVIEQRRRFSI